MKVICDMNYNAWTEKTLQYTVPYIFGCLVVFFKLSSDGRYNVLETTKIFLLTETP